MGNLTFESQVVGVYQDGGTFFARINIDNHEVHIPISNEQFHKMKLGEVIITIQIL